MKKFSIFLAIILGISMFAVTSCGGPSDEEVISDLGTKFMIALYTGNKELAKEICNQTGYETFELVSGMVTMGTLGVNKKMDEATLLGDIDVVEVKKLNENKGVVKIIDAVGDKPKTYSIPVEKDANGAWKIAVTKQSFS